VTGGEPGARLDEPRVALGDLDGDTRRDDGPLPRPEHGVLARDEVESGVPLVRAAGELCLRT
jgi:hypothetical protein